MDFKFSVEAEAFRQEVRQFLKEEPPQSFPTQYPDDGFGRGGWSYEFSRRLGEKGWLTRHWPMEYGGKGRPMHERLILMEELAYARAPARANFFGDSMAHTIMELGTKHVKKELLPSIARGTVTFWLAMSEPNAGSDLLALETRAVEDGDFFVINGQKVWSAWAHLADYGFVFTRTDPNAPRHKGISMFILDKRLPGVTLRPLINLAGYVTHSEVFMDNVRISKEYLVGEKNRGFYQLLKGLEGDRFWGRFVKPAYCKGLLEELVKWVNEHPGPGGKPLGKDAVIRNRLADCAVEIEVCRAMFWHTAWMMEKGMNPVYEASAAKVFADELGQRLFNVGMQVYGHYGLLTPADKLAPLNGLIQRSYLVSRGHTIAGGTSEIVRGTVATIGLGLPRG